MRIDLNDGLDGALKIINTLRRSRSPAFDVRDGTRLEGVVEAIFRPSRHLAVYGSLAPGEPNHVHVQDLAGRWTAGTVRGVLHPDGWGSALGFPALRWDPSADAVAVQLLISDDLPAHWARLDDFEGPEYRRILVPVRNGERTLAVAQLYEGIGC